MDGCEVRLPCAEGEDWARASVAAYHYLRKVPDRRSRPLCYTAHAAGERVGCLFFGRPESTACYRGGLTYGAAAAVAAGRAVYDRWEVLNLARVWLSPDVQPGGRLYSPELLPGFRDRKGGFRSTLASHLIALALARVGFDYLALYPPCFIGQPYQIRVVLSYCDTRLHRGTIYPSAGFRLARRNGDGIETWFTAAVAPLSPAQDAWVRRLARTHPRSERIRNERRTLWDAGR